MQYEDALKIALRHVQARSKESDIELQLVEASTMWESFGWVFFYSSKKFIATGSIRDAIAGNSPIIVDKESGELLTTGTAYPIQHYIDEYRRKKD